MDLTTVTPRGFDAASTDFAAEVGADGPVSVAGGHSAWHVGGPLTPDTRVIAAPAGIVEHDPAEMTVRVRAGTTVADLLDELAERRQTVALPRRPHGSVGGAVAVGWSDLRRPATGPLRDAVLEVTMVAHDGKLVRGGGPTVKNVTGYDLCRLLVGSLGTLGLLAEVVLRTRPAPESSRWVIGPGRPPARPGSVRPAADLFDGDRTWLLLEGHPQVVEQRLGELVDGGFTETDRGPDLPPHRWSLDPAALADHLAAPPAAFVAEMAVGTVHSAAAPPARPAPPIVRSLNHRMKELFDPAGRLNPGRDVMRR